MGYNDYKHAEIENTVKLQPVSKTGASKAALNFHMPPLGTGREYSACNSGIAIFQL